MPGGSCCALCRVPDERIRPKRSDASDEPETMKQLGKSHSCATPLRVVPHLKGSNGSFFRTALISMNSMEHKPSWILGVSAFYHDSAACLLKDGYIVAAAQEERFTRKKHDARFPLNAVGYCLKEGQISVPDLASLVFYDKPLVKFERLLETYLAFAPRGVRSFLAAMPVWLKDKLLLKDLIKRELTRISPVKDRSSLPPILFTEHHESHAASAFYPSPFERAAILCVDGVGEWATTSAWIGEAENLTPLWEIVFPHSLGLLYSAFTYFTGFKVNSGEYKVMGLAPYGRPKYVKAIYDHLIELKPDGTFRLNMEYFNYCTGLTMTNGKFDALFDGPRRKPESPLTQREMDLRAPFRRSPKKQCCGWPTLSIGKPDVRICAWQAEWP